VGKEKKKKKSHRRYTRVPRKDQKKKKKGKGRVRTLRRDNPLFVLWFKGKIGGTVMWGENEIDEEGESLTWERR